MFVTMSELEFFLLTKVLIQSFNTMDLVKFLERNQKLHIWTITITSMGTSCKTMSIIKKVEKNEKPRLYWQNKQHAYN